MKHNLFCFLFLVLVNLFYYTLTTTASPIINGIPDQHHHFKFHVSIHNKNKPRNEYEQVCGGSIISERYILTAAHCFITKLNGNIKEIFYPYGRTKIVAGTNHMNGPGITRYIIRAFIPEEHNVISSNNHPGYMVEADIAVAELSADLGLHQYAHRLAIMPLEPLDPHSDAGINEQATFCGCGLDILVQHSGGESHPAKSGCTINKFMTVKILGRNECPVFDKTICARNADERVYRTPSNGDSGAGLVYNNKIIGVLSSGPRVGNIVEPIKFTRLHQHMSFIKEAQNPHGDHRFMITLDTHLNPPLIGHNRNPQHPRPHDGSSSSSAEGKKKPPQTKHYHGLPG